MAGRLATVAGRSRTNPWPATATPATCGCAPGPGGARAGPAAGPAVGTQVEPPLPLSQAAPT